MRDQKFLPVLLLPVAAAAAVFSPILKYPLSVWAEPREVLLHLALTAVLYIALSTRLNILSTATGALLFGLCPAHAFVWAAGGHGSKEIFLYVLFLAASAGAAHGFDRFYAFLKTQEAVVRYLFFAATILLLLAMALVSVQTNAVWKDETTLWRWRSSHHPSVKAFNALGRLLQAADDAAPAIKIYERSLKLDPHDQEAHFALADIDLRLRKTEEVIGVYNRLLKFYPEDEGVYTRIIEGYGRAIAKYPQESIYQEKREDVLAAYEQVSKRKKYTANDYYNLGFLYEQVGGFEEAMRFYRKALALSPKHEKTLLNLAHRYQEAGDIKTALLLYGRLVHVNPRSTAGYLNMGILYNALGDADKARYLYQKVISIDPNNAGAYFNLGYLNESAGELREALNDYEKAVENDPRHAEAYYNMGNVYAALQQYPEAIASYLKTVGINPNHQNVYVNLSILSFKSKDFQGSIRYLEEARLLGYNPPAEYLKTLEPYRKK